MPRDNSPGMQKTPATSSAGVICSDLCRTDPYTIQISIKCIIPLLHFLRLNKVQAFVCPAGFRCRHFQQKMPIRITNLQISKRVPGQDIWFTGSLICNRLI